MRPFIQTVGAYLKSWHSRNGLSRERMGPSAAAAFDAELGALVEPYCPEGVLELGISGRIAWGNPLEPAAR